MPFFALRTAFWGDLMLSPWPAAPVGKKALGFEILIWYNGRLVEVDVKTRVKDCVFLPRQFSSAKRHSKEIDLNFALYCARVCRVRDDFVRWAGLPRRTCHQVVGGERCTVYPSVGWWS